MRTLDEILGALTIISQFTTLIPGATIPSEVAQKLLAIAQATVKAHEAATGQPLDLALLKPVELA